jgi:MFS family permease
MMFYGWRIVAVSFVTHFLTVGTVFYSFGVFFHPLAEEFHWTRAEVSWGFSLAAVVGAVYGPIFGRLVDRYGPRPVQLFGAVVLGLAFATFSAIQSLLQFYLCMGLLVALGSSALGPVSSNTAVARWFVRRRGRALGIATAGISMGGVVFVPLTQELTARIGWRGAALTIAALIVAIGVPPVALWMRRSPESMGLRPDGDEPLPPPGGAAIAELEAELERSLTAREAVRQPTFWLIAGAFALTVSGLSAILLHQIPYLVDQGVPATVASWVLGGTAAVGVIGKLGFGTLMEKFDQRRVILFCFVLQAVGIVLLFFASSPLVLAAYVLVYGYSMGGNATLQATILGECFGRMHYGSIAGRMGPIIVVTQAAGVPLVGWIRDRTGSYSLAFGMILASTLVAAVAIWMLRIPARAAR